MNEILLKKIQREIDEYRDRLLGYILDYEINMDQCLFDLNNFVSGILLVINAMELSEESKVIDDYLIRTEEYIVDKAPNALYQASMELRREEAEEHTNE